MPNIKKAAANRLDDLSAIEPQQSIVIRTVKPQTDSANLKQVEKGTISTDDKLSRLLSQVNRIVSLPLSDLIIEENVRQEVDTTSTEFAELVNSIKETGIMQNLIVEIRLGEGTEYRLVCVSGQRRLMAARVAGVEKTFVLLKQFESDAQRVIAGLAENMLRKGLHAFDIADGYRRLLAEGWGQAQICDYFDRDRKHVQRYLKLAEYPEEIKRKVREHPTVFSARVLLNEFAAKSLTPDKLQESISNRIAAAQITTEEGKPKKRAARKLRDQTDFEREMTQTYSEKLSISINWQGTEEQGSVNLRYQTPDELKYLLQQLDKLAA